MATACAAPNPIPRLDERRERNNNSHSQHGPVSGGRHHLGIRGRNHLGNGGRLRRNRQPDAACSRIGRFYLAYYLEWDEPGQEAASRAFCRKVFEDLKPVSNGSYINEMDQEGRPEDIHQCYSPQAWARLAALRRQWDPAGVFHGFYGQS